MVTTENTRRKLLIIYTGGTIGMIENPATGALVPVDFNHLIENVPKLKMLDYVIDNFQFNPPIDSASMNPRHWGEIANVIKDKYYDYDGFVVLHGTDTMAYTASALSFMLENLDKPVIITGSQLPIGEVRTDGEENLITALQVAASQDSEGNPMVREVAILFENSLWRGNRSTKTSSDKFDAFKSNNYPKLAKIGLGVAFNKEALRHTYPTRPLSVHTNMDVNVACLDLFPGIPESTVHHFLQIPGLRGVVMKTFGAGNGPNDGWFLDEIKEAVDRGIVIVNITQCSNGMVLPTRYLTGLELTKAGVISGGDMTMEAALTKMMYLFGKGLSSEEVKKRMEIPICGELTLA